MRKENTNKIISKVYDKFSISDFDYFKEEGHLNPKREIEWDDNKPILNQVYDRLQKMKNDIIRKQIDVTPEEEKTPGALFGEGIPKGIPLPLLQAIELSGGSNPIIDLPDFLLDRVCL